MPWTFGVSDDPLPPTRTVQGGEGGNVGSNTPVGLGLSPERYCLPRAYPARAPRTGDVIPRTCLHRPLPNGPQGETLPKASTCNTWS